MISTRTKLILATLAMAAPLTPAMADYVLVGVTDKQAIYLDRSSIKQKGDKTEAVTVSVFDPAARGIAYIETPNRFHCSFGTVDPRPSMIYDERGEKGVRTAFGGGTQVIPRTSPLFLAKEMVCDGKKPGDLPVLSSIDSIRRDAQSQIAGVKGTR